LNYGGGLKHYKNNSVWYETGTFCTSLTTPGFNIESLQSEKQQMPTETALLQNYPNLINPAATIECLLKDKGHVILKVYDLLGREIITSVDDFKETGFNKIEFDGSKLSYRLYLIKMTFQPLEDVTTVYLKKMLLIK
jgi:hypothetical protein